MADPLITFLSDFGYEDEFVGVCHGVIARRCPAARVIDITHGVAPHDVRAGALMLRAALPFLAPAVHLAIVDPGVGVEPGAEQNAAARRAVAIAAGGDGRLLVGPDNGLLWPAAQALGGARAAADIGRSPEALEPIAPTFHGRDLFAPVAAALACGQTLEEVGEPIDVRELQTLELLRAHADDGGLRAHALDVDRFGNVTLDASAEQLARALGEPPHELEVRSASVRTVARYGRTFGDVVAGELVLHEDSRRLLALAINRGSAAADLDVHAGDELVLRAR